MSKPNTADSFWLRVRKGGPDQCWEWQGARTSSGYGNLSWQGSHVQAHRVAYYLTAGGIALATGFRQEGKAKRYKRFVLHRCDNRACCNPDHLFLGSMSANLVDAYAKGRKAQPRSNHVNAKLSAAQVRRIRRVYAKGEVRQIDLAFEYRVSQVAISKIIRNETYKDVA